jgi:hypothetical protein
MIKNYKNTYENRTVLLDGQTFEECTFINCTLQFGGTDEVALVSNKIINCKWALSGNAATTIGFLKALYQGGGGFGQQLVESIFSEIRNSKELEVK